MTVLRTLIGHLIDVACRQQYPTVARKGLKRRCWLPRHWTVVEDSGGRPAAKAAVQDAKDCPRVALAKRVGKFLHRNGRVMQRIHPCIVRRQSVVPRPMPRERDNDRVIRPSLSKRGLNRLPNSRNGCRFVNEQRRV